MYQTIYLLHKFYITRTRQRREVLQVHNGRTEHRLDVNYQSNIY